MYVNIFIYKFNSGLKSHQISGYCVTDSCDTM